MLKEVVEAYLKLFPKDRRKLSLLLDQLKKDEDLDDRRNFRGHIAGDAVIVSPDFQKILLIYHKRFKRWQQPGGHLEKDEEGPWLTAEREAEEETGISALKRLNITDDYRIPFHIATGDVPANQVKNEAYHWHHDFRYAFVATSEDLGSAIDEAIGGAKWLPLKDLKAEGVHDFDISIARLKDLLSHRD